MTHQINEELIKAFKNHLDYYKDLKDKWEFLKTPEDRAFHAGKTQGMLLGLEVIERISIPQPEQSWEFCPNCGSKEIHHQEFKADGELHRQCKRCHQEYFSKVDYLESMRKTLEKLYLKSISQPVNIVSGIDCKGEIVRYEPLNVEIVSRENIDERPNRWLVKYKYAVLDYFLTENHAKDFCTEHGLKVVKEKE